MKLIVRTFRSVSEGYSYLNKISLEGHEPIQFLPIDGGCHLIVKVQSATEEPFLELSEEVVKAYLSLNEGKVKKVIAVLDIKDLTSGLMMAQEFFDKGILIHEIRNFKKISEPGYLIVSHDDHGLLKNTIGEKPHAIFDSKNSALMNFLGFSNITVN